MRWFLFLLFLVAAPAEALTVKFTPPNTLWTVCVLTVDNQIVIPNLIPAVSCPLDPVNRCASVALALTTGSHGVQIACTDPPPGAASNPVTVMVGPTPTRTATPIPSATRVPTAVPTAQFQGTALAKTMVPTGSGSKNLGVIHDGIFPSPTSIDATQQYDTFNGIPSTEEWIGYTFPSPQTFTKLVYQEGLHFWDGGWFTSLRVQVLQNGVWTTVAGVQATPVYPGATGASWATYTLTFPATLGDGIRIDGTPGGAHTFIGVGELQVFMLPPPAPNLISVLP